MAWIRSPSVYDYRYRQPDTEEEAKALRDRMLADVAAGRAPRQRPTFGQLLDAVLEVADLDFTTLGMYRGYIERTIRPAVQWLCAFGRRVLMVGAAM